MLSRRSFLNGLPIGLAGLASLETLSNGPAFAADADSITMAFPSDVANWDSISSGQGVHVPLHRSVFDLAVNFKPDLSVGPSLVTGHRWLDDKGMVLELTIREGVTFHNGDPMTSDDFKFSLQERPAADKSLMIAGLWGDTKVRTMETPSPTKAIFHFTAPYVSAPSLLGSMPAYILPRRYFEQVGRQKFLEAPIGTGPYRLIDYQRNSRIILEAYDKYWGGVPRIKRVTFNIMKDASTRIAAIQSGQVDFASNLPVREVQRLGKLPGLTGAMHPVTSTIMIQMVNKGVFQDQNVRLAMHHAIDKEALSKAFYAGVAKPVSMFSSDGPANDPSFKFEYSQQRAKELLAKSGYSLEKPVKIPFASINALFPNDYDVARTIVQMWKQVGIDAELQILEQPKYFELGHADKLEMPVLYAWNSSTGEPELFTGLVLDPKKRNAIWKSNDIPPRLDPLFLEPDFDKRMAGYRAFERWSVEQGYAFPLLLNTATIVHSSKIGYVPYRNGWLLPATWSLS